MGKKKLASDIKWFDISNYDELSELTVGQFCRELFNRVFIWNIKEQPEWMIFAYTWQPVLQGQVLLTYTVPCSIDTITPEEDCLCKKSNTLELGIAPVNKRLLNGIAQYSNKQQYTLEIINIEQLELTLCIQCNSKLRQSLTIENKQSTQTINPAIFCNDCITTIYQDFNEDISPLNTDLVCCKPTEINPDDCSSFINLNHYLNKKGNLLRVNLEDFTDDELVDHLRYQLTKMRTLFNIPSPQIDSKKRMELHLKQLIKNAFNYRIIPVIDLKIFQHSPFEDSSLNNDNVVTYEQIADLVFSDHISHDKEWVRQTLIQKHMAALLGNNTIEQILAYVKSNPAVKEQLMSEFIAM